MEENLTVAEVVNGTITTLRQNAQAVLIFVVIFASLGIALELGLNQIGNGLLGQFEPEWLLSWLGVGAGLGGLLFLILAVIGEYLLWEAMLKRHYQLEPGGRRILAFIGLQIVTTIGISLGFVLFIIPGLIFTARWSMGPAFLIVERKGIIESIGDSWDEVSGRTTPIVLAFLIAVVLVAGINFALGASAAAGAANSLAPVSLITTVLSQLLAQLSTVLQIGLGVFLFGRLHGSSEVLSEVFA